jgi:hypothetical protein
VFSYNEAVKGTGSQCGFQAKSLPGMQATGSRGLLRIPFIEEGYQSVFLFLGCAMSKSEMLASGQGSFGSKFVRVGPRAADAAPLEYFLATGLGSRGGPNKVSNKLRSKPTSYLSKDAVPLEYFLATGLRSRGGPNKVSNKLRRCPSSYLFH